MVYKNTLQKSSVRYIIFNEDDVWYGIGLEFNIVEEGDDPVEVMAALFQAIAGYWETARKLKARPMPLNQEPDAEYQKLWSDLEKNKIAKANEAKDVFSFGFHHPFAALAPAMSR